MLGPVLMTVCLGFALLSVYVVRTAEANFTAGIDEELTRASAAQANQGGGQAAGAPPDGVAGSTQDLSVDFPIQLTLSRDGTVLDKVRNTNPFDTAVLAQLVGNPGTVTVDGDPRYRARVVVHPTGNTSVTALSMAQMDASIASLRNSLIFGGLVVFVFCSVIVWWIATRVARPVASMALVANRIAAGALDTTINPPAGGSREVAALAADLQGMVDRLRQTIADREQQADAATKSRDAMRRFLADASHELRTPLTALKGYSELYRHRMLAEPADLDRAMLRIGSESQRLTRLVNDMLQLARGQAPEVSHEDVDLQQIVTGLVEDLRAAFPGHPIEFTTVTDKPVIVRGDGDRLHQAFLNLGANACQHNTPDVEIAIRLEATASAAALSVIDHGRGIEDQHLDKLFTPFYRADSSRSRTNSAGAGLGLALTELIVTAHHGTIVHEPTPGGGATFRIEIPSVGSGI
jgi:two-component system, OmpR family, sensor kinase